MSLDVELDVLLRSSSFVPTLSLVSVVLVALSAIALFLRYRKASEPSALAVGKSLQQNGIAEDATGPKVTLLYGTQTGTAERFSKQLKTEMSSRYGESNHYSIVDIEDYKAEELLCEETLVFFLMATYGDGEPTDNAADFYNWLIKAGKEAEDGSGETLLKVCSGRLWYCACLYLANITCALQSQVFMNAQHAHQSAQVTTIQTFHADALQWQQLQVADVTLTSAPTCCLFFAVLLCIRHKAAWSLSGQAVFSLLSA